MSPSMTVRDILVKIESVQDNLFFFPEGNGLPQKNDTKWSKKWFYKVLIQWNWLNMQITRFTIIFVKKAVNMQVYYLRF